MKKLIIYIFLFFLSIISGKCQILRIDTILHIDSLLILKSYEKYREFETYICGRDTNVLFIDNSSFYKAKIDSLKKSNEYLNRLILKNKSIESLFIGIKISSGGCFYCTNSEYIYILYSKDFKIKEKGMILRFDELNHDYYRGFVSFQKEFMDSIIVILNDNQSYSKNQECPLIEEDKQVYLFSKYGKQIDFQIIQNNKEFSNSIDCLPYHYGLNHELYRQLDELVERNIKQLDFKTVSKILNSNSKILQNNKITDELIDIFNRTFRNE